MQASDELAPVSLDSEFGGQGIAWLLPTQKCVLGHIMHSCLCSNSPGEHNVIEQSVEDEDCGKDD
jgi:hypothetical protein